MDGGIGIMERNFDGAKYVIACMRERYSCRKFTNRHIDDDLLDELIATGLCAPTGGNLQPYSIIIVRKRETKDAVSKLCGQAFIAEADVNLIFILDWSKIENYAKDQDAPFVVNNSFSHNLIAFADIVCAAQIIEMAAFMSGLGTCFIGNILGNGSKLSQLLNLPYKSYPILVLAMGYPDLKSRERMCKTPYKAMVFNEEYPDNTISLNEQLDIKYGGMSVKLPKAEECAQQWLDNIKESLLTTYDKERTEEIAREIKASGRINEMQRRFCLKYKASKSIGKSQQIKEDMSQCGIEM